MRIVLMVVALWALLTWVWAISTRRHAGIPLAAGTADRVVLAAVPVMIVLLLAAAYWGGRS
jgi:hypothetical protein